jgi:hypothetical protein
MTITGNTTLSGLSDGFHSLTVYANDNIGRFGASETLYFSIAKEKEPEPSESQEPLEPFPTVPVAVACGVSIAAVAVGLLLYFKKRKR